MARINMFASFKHWNENYSRNILRLPLYFLPLTEKGSRIFLAWNGCIQIGCRFLENCKALINVYGFAGGRHHCLSVFKEHLEIVDLMREGKCFAFELFFKEICVHIIKSCEIQPSYYMLNTHKLVLRENFPCLIEDHAFSSEYYILCENATLNFDQNFFSIYSMRM